MNHPTTQPPNHPTTQPPNHLTAGLGRSISYYLLAVIILIFQACNKDALDGDSPSETSTGNSEPVVFNVSDQSINSRSSEDVRTLLGSQRENPFNVEKMAQAHRNLYGSLLTRMETTHLYVKFVPSSLADMAALDSMDLSLFDFPLEYEVLEMGDYYQEPEEGVFPVLYTVVDPDFVFPLVAHEIISELYLDKSNPLLVAESFRLTENLDRLQDQIQLTGLRVEDFGGDGLPLIPICPPGCVAILEINDSTVPVSVTWLCDCNPPPPPPPPPNPTNSCGCPVFSSNRKPAGCVKVEDTELSTPETPSTFLPVRRVKVIAWDGWFNIDNTETDDNGCWKINDEYHGNAWFWIKFKNNRCKIRGTESNFKAAWQWLFTITDYVGKLHGPNYNSIEVNYHMWISNGSKAHRYWGAATVNNALHEFHDFATEDGIAHPPVGLDIYIGHNQHYGYALMSAQNELSAAAGAAMGAVTSIFAGPLAPLIALVGWLVTKAYLPDVFIGTDFTHSDQQKGLAYHEIAHASHFSQVGSAYWLQLVTAEIFANGHGNAGSDNAGIISVCESWAEYLGKHLYTHRTYGESNSIEDDWLKQLEQTWNETQNHIPVGLYHDLMDIGEPTFTIFGVTVSACNQKEYPDCTIIQDDVSGFTNIQMFSCLTSDTYSINEFRNCINSNFTNVTGNTVAAVNALVDSY